MLSPIIEQNLQKFALSTAQQRNGILVAFLIPRQVQVNVFSVFDFQTDLHKFSNNFCMRHKINAANAA